MVLQECTPYMHSFLVVNTPKPKSTACWTHEQNYHHFFLNYRVSSEGKKVDQPVCFLHIIAIIIIKTLTVIHQEPKGGIVEMVYERLAVVRGKDHKSLFVFWDRKCLNYGQDWEKGFLNGLLNSQVIVLLISTKVQYRTIIWFFLTVN